MSRLHKGKGIIRVCMMIKKKFKATKNKATDFNKPMTASSSIIKLTENDKGEADGEMGGVGIFLASCMNKQSKICLV